MTGEPQMTEKICSALSIPFPECHLLLVRPSSYARYATGCLGPYRAKSGDDLVEGLDVELKKEHRERWSCPQENPASEGRVKMVSHMLVHFFSAAMEIEGRGSGVSVLLNKLHMRYNRRRDGKNPRLWVHVIFLDIVTPPPFSMVSRSKQQHLFHAGIICFKAVSGCVSWPLVSSSS